MVLTNIRKAHSAYDKFQRDAKSVVAKPIECSTTQGHGRARPQRKLDQELMSLEALVLKGDPLSDDDVLRAASTADDFGRVGEGRACVGICVAKFVQARKLRAASHQLPHQIPQGWLSFAHKNKRREAKPFGTPHQS